MVVYNLIVDYPGLYWMASIINLTLGVLIFSYVLMSSRDRKASKYYVK